MIGVFVETCEDGSLLVVAQWPHTNVARFGNENRFPASPQNDLRLSPLRGANAGDGEEM